MEIICYLCNVNHETPIVNELLQEVERLVGMKILSPKDFEWLADRLPHGERLSISTLKRLWHYVPSRHEPRRTTLDILSRFCGYGGWIEFCRLRQQDSDFLGGAIRVATLSVGCHIEMTWNPDRRIVVQKRADGSLLVVKAEHCKLQTGDIFRTPWLAEGQPLCATCLHRHGQPLPDYVAGRQHGLTSVVLC